MALGLCVFVALVAAINWLANPYGAWPISAINPIYRKGAAERVATPYRVRSAEPSVMLLGSSRMVYGMKIDQGERDGVLNAGLFGANLDEMAAVLEIGLRNPKLKRVIWALDFFAFDNNLAGTIDPQTRLRLAGNERLKITETLLSLDALDLSRRMLARAIFGRHSLAAARSMPIPWTQDQIRTEFARPGKNDLDQTSRAVIEAQVGYWIPIYAKYQWSDSRLALFQSAVARARQAGVEVIFFIPPLSDYELEALRQGGQWPAFQRWKRMLAESGPYWDFSGYNEIAEQVDLFSDVAHYRPVVGFTILRRLLGDDCSRCGERANQVLTSALWIAPATIDHALAVQDDRKAAFLSRNSPVTQMVDELRRRSAAVVQSNFSGNSNSESARASESATPDVSQDR